MNEITAFRERDDPHIFRPQRHVEVIVGIVCEFSSQDESTGIAAHQSFDIIGEILNVIVAEGSLEKGKANGRFDDFFRHDAGGNWFSADTVAVSIPSATPPF